MSEEQRASDYRAMMTARRRNKASRERALAGSRAARIAVNDAWQPVTDWLAERNADGQEDDSEDGGQIFNVNAG